MQQRAGAAVEVARVEHLPRVHQQLGLLGERNSAEGGENVVQVVRRAVLPPAEQSLHLDVDVEVEQGHHRAQPPGDGRIDTALVAVHADRQPVDHALAGPGRRVLEDAAADAHAGQCDDTAPARPVRAAARPGGPAVRCAGGTDTLRPPSAAERRWCWSRTSGSDR